MDKTTMDKTIISCALTGVLTDPDRYPVPVTPEEMAAEARRAFEAGASIMHCHFRNQSEGLGYLPTWDVDVVDEIAGAIRDACPGVILNFSTGVVGDDISGPLACLERSRPEMAALNAGSPMPRMRSNRRASRLAHSDGLWMPRSLLQKGLPAAVRF